MAGLPKIVPIASGTVRPHFTPEPMKEYHVLIPDCTEVAGKAVVDKRVKLSASQAEFWMDQGVLGEEAGESKVGDALKK